MDWLHNNTHIGVFGGVVGVDHYMTHQGMPCVNGKPQEFANQDEYAALQKQRFPRIKVLQYRIPSAVPYEAVIHDKMVTDPDAFVRWHHPPTNNGSICLMPYEEHKTQGYNCSWPIIAAAYDWSQQRVREWWLENVIKPSLKVADGAWIDNDGPDNGAGMCSGNWGPTIPPPYPALNDTESEVFCDGETAAVTLAHEWLIANGGYDYNCMTFIHDNQSLPIASDSPEVCARKLQRLDHYSPANSVALYTDRTRPYIYDDATMSQAVAVFLLTRAEYWYFGHPNANTYNVTTAALLLSDFGAPLANMTQTKYLFQRKYEKAIISLDCTTLTANIDINTHSSTTVE